MTHNQCENLFQGGKTLLGRSKLVVGEGQSFKCGNNYNKLEEHWAKQFHPQFGRYMAWVWFSVGAENLVKAALICNGKITGKPITLGYPIFTNTQPRSDWMNNVLNPKAGVYGSAEAKKYDFGTLGSIWRSKLDELCAQREIPPDKRKELKVAYKYLTQVIRNRDGHTYIENARKKDFPAVAAVFVPAFNTLVQAMIDNGHSFGGAT